MSCPLLLDAPSATDVSVLELIYSLLGRVIGGLNRSSISSHMGGGVSLCALSPTLGHLYVLITVLCTVFKVALTV